MTRITNCSVPATIFRDPFIKKFGLEQNNALDEPIIMYACGEHTIKKIKHREALTVIIWTGTDANRIKDYIPVLSRENVFHISTSVFINKDLERAGLKYKYLPIVVNSYPDLVPVKKGDSIFFYQGSTSHRKTYRLPMVKSIMKEFPDTPLIVVSNNSHKWEDLKKVYAKCFLGLRLIAHDGICHSAIEMGLMGIKTVSNHKMPHTISYATRPNIINIIESERKKIGEVDLLTARKLRDYIDIPDNWLYTEFYGDSNF